MNTNLPQSQPIQIRDPELSLAIAEVRSLLADAAANIRTATEDDAIMAETPLEAQSAMECATQSITSALHRLDFVCPKKRSAASPSPDGPTRQQGQFLAFIREYTMRNEAGIAPCHADFQQFFDLTPPSVNSMLIRLEQRGFIRRIPGKTRAIELIISTDLIPPLDRPFKFALK